jgi:electron transfer flavoprotein beta subunit
VQEPIACDETTQVMQYELPPAKQGVKLVAPDNMDELVRLLKEEAKVI